MLGTNIHQLTELELCFHVPHVWLDTQVLLKCLLWIGYALSELTGSTTLLPGCFTHLYKEALDGIQLCEPPI